MLKHYYRLVYWKRCLTRGLPGHRPPGHRRVPGELRERLRPLMVFTVIVLVVLALSAVLGSLPHLAGGPYGLHG